MEAVLAHDNSDMVTFQVLPKKLKTQFRLAEIHGGT